MLKQSTENAIDIQVTTVTECDAICASDSITCADKFYVFVSFGRNFYVACCLLMLFLNSKSLIATIGRVVCRLHLRRVPYQPKPWLSVKMFPNCINHNIYTFSVLIAVSLSVTAKLSICHYTLWHLYFVHFMVSVRVSAEQATELCVGCIFCWLMPDPTECALACLKSIFHRFGLNVSVFSVFLVPLPTRCASKLSRAQELAHSWTQFKF